MKDVKINNEAIKSLVNSPRSGSKTFLWDREVRGYGVYKTSKGRATFVYRYRIGVNVRSKVLGTIADTTVAQARDLARDLAYQRRLGIDPVQKARDEKEEAKRSDHLIVRNYAEDFIARKETSKAPFPDYVKNTIRNQIVANLGDRRMDKVTLPEVEAVGRRIIEETGASGRWFYTYVKQMFHDADKRDAIAKSPLKALVVPLPQERDRVLSGAELRLVLMAARDMQDARGDMVEMLVRVPKRRSEVNDLPWHEIDRSGETWVWNIPKERSKNKTAQEIVLPPQVRALLERQMPDEGGRTGEVFARGTGLTPALAHSARQILDAGMHRRSELAEAAGIKVPRVEHFTVHDFRTAVATALQKAPFKVLPHVIEAMLNHLPPSKVQRTYQQDRYAPEVGDALAAWNDHIDALLGNDADWPGGPVLPRMHGSEVKRRHVAFRAGWPSLKPSAKGKNGKGSADDE